MMFGMMRAMRVKKEEIARARRIAQRYVAQFDAPYESTKAFYRFLKKHACFKSGTSYLDIGAGFGCVAAHFAKKEPRSRFLGVDYNPACVKIGARAIKKHRLDNLKLKGGDWFHLPSLMKGVFDGVFNTHTFCVFRDSIDATDELIKLKPRWVAFNSLFWDGYTDVFIHTRDSTKPAADVGSPDSDLNIFSLPTLRKHLKNHGYSRVYAQPFTISIDLPRPADGRRGTYTVETEWSKRSQFSGPVYLPWHFVLAMRTRP